MIKTIIVSFNVYICKNEQFSSHTQPYDPFAADCWAMGVMLFCMLNNRFPFHFDYHEQMLSEQLRGSAYIKTRYVKVFPRDLRQLQEAFFIVREEDRITMSAVLEHPWILRKGK